MPPTRQIHLQDRGGSGLEHREFILGREALATVAIVGMRHCAATLAI
jgi:hypothetical protein